MNESGYCQCGCGNKTNLAVKTWPRWGYVKGKPMRFLVGHSSRVRDYRGEKNPRWSGGRSVSSGGYVRRYTPGHPRADRSGRVLEHILVAEKALGKMLPPGTEVHHVNGDKSDNRNSNLVVCPDGGYHQLLEVRTLRFLWAFYQRQKENAPPRGRTVP